MLPRKTKTRIVESPSKGISTLSGVSLAHFIEPWVRHLCTCKWD